MNATRSDLPLHMLQTLDRTDAYVKSRLHEPPLLREVGDAVGCSIRTLNYYFREAFGTSPMAYFRTQRLNAARERLQRSANDREPVLVIDVAMEHGFWHLGHFARAYREHFGETPSATIANSRSQFLLRRRP